ACPEDHDQPRRADWVRAPAVFAWMGPEASDPLPALLDALRRDNWQRQQEAADVLARLGAAAVPALLDEVAGGGPGADYAGKALAAMDASVVLPVLPRL